MRISSIDVGSNAIRLVIVEIHKNGRWEQIKKFRAPLRLGTDVFQYKRLQTETMLELAQVFKKIAKLNKKYRVEKVLAIATSAMRDAQNKKQALTLIKKESKIKLRIISGQEEARIIRNAIIKSNSNHFANSLLIDIGGGSAEITGLNGQKIVFSKSYPLGVVRLLNLEQKQISIHDHCYKYINKIKLTQAKIKYDVGIGTGGNFDALARLKLAILKKAPQTHMTKEELLKIQKIWHKMSYDSKINLGLRPDRIDVLALAINLILMIMDQFKLNHLKIPMTGLKEGAIHELLDS
ncbi:MAG: hypothetical protein ACK4VO_06270 [Pseudobdellovibrio sp.]